MKNTVYQNASIVTGISVAERGLGFLYRIVLSRLIGAEGLGLYQVALSLFTLFLTLGTGGIPITVSRMLAKSKAENDLKGERAALSAGIALTLLLSLPLCLFLWAFGGKMTFLFADMRSWKVLKILLVGLCFSGVYSVIRGHFWGNKRFFASSLLELSEEIVMVLAGLVLLRGVSSPAVGAERAAWAVVLSYLFSSLAAILYFLLSGGKISNPKNSLKPLFNAAMPITFVRASGSLINSAVAVLLPAMLIRAGVDESDALRLFGVLSGMVIPVLFLPSTLIGSLALVLVPELAEDYYKGNAPRLRKNVERGLNFTFLIACILIPFLFVLGEDFGRIAFSDLSAGKMIEKSCILLLPMSLTMISTSILNSIGFEKPTFLFFFIGAAALLLCILFLSPILGAYSYVVGLGASYVLTATCNLMFLYKSCPLFQKGRGQVRVYPFLSALILLLSVTLLGQLCHALLVKVTGELLCVALTAICMALITLLLYFAVRLFSKKVKNSAITK